MKYYLIGLGVARRCFLTRKKCFLLLMTRPFVASGNVNIQNFVCKDISCISKTSIALISNVLLVEENKNSSEMSEYFDRSSYICLLVKLLGCSMDEADELVEQNINSLKASFQRSEECIAILTDSGIVPRNIQSNFWLLGFEKDELKCRIDLLKRWKFNNINHGLSLLKLPLNSLARFTLQAEKDMRLNKGLNRITYLAKYVQCEVTQVCDVFVKYGFMLKMNMETMKEILKIVKAHEISSQDLLSDPWLFNFTLSFISTRSKLLNQMQAKQKSTIVKPWMLRCKETTFNRCFELKDDNIAARGSYLDLIDLLSNELSLSKEEVEEMFLKHPALAKISYSKVKDMIDFLKDMGFSSHMIYQTPRVLCHKQATLLARLTELKRVNPNLVNLHNICRNKKDYVALLNRIS